MNPEDMDSLNPQSAPSEPAAHEPASEPAASPGVAGETADPRGGGDPRDLVQRDLSARFERNIAVRGIGAAGQARLRRARVAVVGAGGLGSAVLPYLVGAGVERIGIADFDTVSAANLCRQVLYTTAQVGTPKVAAAAGYLQARSPELQVRDLGRIDAGNARALLADYDLVMECSDNFATKALVAGACRDLGLPLVWGTAVGVNLQVTVLWEPPPVIPPLLRRAGAGVSVAAGGSDWNAGNTGVSGDAVSGAREAVSQPAGGTDSVVAFGSSGSRGATLDSDVNLSEKSRLAPHEIVAPKTNASANWPYPATTLTDLYPSWPDMVAASQDQVLTDRASAGDTVRNASLPATPDSPAPAYDSATQGILGATCAAAGAAMVAEAVKLLTGAGDLLCGRVLTADLWAPSWRVLTFKRLN